MTTHVESTALEQEGADAPAAATKPLATATQTPHERLVASREAIRNALVRHEPRSARKRRERQAQAAAAPGDAPPSPSFTERMTDLFSQVPLSGLATRWLSRWWRRNPWRSTIEFAVEAADEVARPLARKHPWLLVGGAFAVGAALSRPTVWRRATSVALMVGLIPRVNVTSIVQSMTSMAQGLLNDRGAQPDDGSSPEATPGNAASSASQPPSQHAPAAPTQSHGPAADVPPSAEGTSTDSPGSRRMAATETSH